MSTFQEKEMVERVNKIFTVLGITAVWNPAKLMESTAATTSSSATSASPGNGEASLSNRKIPAATTKAKLFECFYEPLKHNALVIFQYRCTNEDGQQFVERQRQLLQQLRQKFLEIEEQLRKPKEGHDFTHDFTAIIELMEQQIDNRGKCLQAQRAMLTRKIERNEAIMSANKRKIAANQLELKISLDKLKELDGDS